MKKKIMMLALGVALFCSACGETVTETKESKISEEATKEASNEESKEEEKSTASSGEAQTSEESTEEIAETIETTEASIEPSDVDIDPIVVDDPVETIEAGTIYYDEDRQLVIYKEASELTPMEYYEKYINDRASFDESSCTFASASNPVYWGPTFCLYDVNQDGEDDLIINGALGLRCKMFSEIVMTTPDGYTTLFFDGEVTGFSENIVFFDDPDYGYAGEEFYEHSYALAFKPDTTYDEILFKRYDAQYADPETDEEWAEPIVLFEGYFVNNEEVTAEEYEAQEQTIVPTTSTVFHEMNLEEMSNVFALPEE